MWIDALRDAWVDYATSSIALLIAVIGVLAQTRREKKRWPRNVTVFGWILTVLAVGNFAFSWSSTTAINQRNAQVSYWAFREIETGITELLTPYAYRAGPPSGELRFKLARTYRASRIFEGMCEVDLRAPIGASALTWGEPSADLTWARFLTTHTETAQRVLRTTATSYSSVLPVETLNLIGQVVTHPWHDWVQAVARPEIKDNAPGSAPDNHGSTAARGSLTLCSQNLYSTGYRRTAQEFGQAVENLENVTGSAFMDLAARLGKEDPNPIFYRRHETAGYIPNRP